MPPVPSESRIIHSSRGDGAAARLYASAPLLARVAPGAYVRQAQWDGLFQEERARVRARAAADRRRSGGWAFDAATAAALHGLPLYRVSADRVDVARAGAHPQHSSALVRRRYVPLPPRDVTVVDGLPVTTLDRTVYDVIRLLSREAAVVCFDAALRKVAWDDSDNSFDVAVAERFRAAVRSRVIAHAGARGIRQARFVCEFADGRAQLPGESVSRLWMAELGVHAPELQVRIGLPDGRYALLDFAWPSHRRWAEFDGEVKYSDPSRLAGRTRADVMTAQLARQHAVEQATGWRCVRWGFAQMASIDDFADWLRGAGLLRRRGPA